MLNKSLLNKKKNVVKYVFKFYFKDLKINFKLFQRALMCC